MQCTAVWQTLADAAQLFAVFWSTAVITTLLISFACLGFSLVLLLCFFVARGCVSADTKNKYVIGKLWRSELPVLLALVLGNYLHPTENERFSSALSCWRCARLSASSAA